MATTTVRIEAKTHIALRDLAGELGLTMQEALARAVEAYRRHRLLEQTNAGFAAWRADPVAWQEELEERRLWDTTLADGLSEEP
jgi:hypothetical protein